VLLDFNHAHEPNFVTVTRSVQSARDSLVKMIHRQDGGVLAPLDD
jgi:hypothetical protein